MENQKQQIIKTAGEMFFRLGIRSVLIDDICRELGMSKKTFYVYFAGKDELGSAVGHIGIDYGFIPGKPVDLRPGRLKLFVQGPD